MASARMDELRDKSAAELRDELLAAQRSLMGLRIQLVHQASENTSGLGRLKREVAQIKTAIREKQAKGTAEDGAGGEGSEGEGGK